VTAVLLFKLHIARLTSLHITNAKRALVPNIHTISLNLDLEHLKGLLTNNALWVVTAATKSLDLHNDVTTIPLLIILPAAACLKRAFSLDFSSTISLQNDENYWSLGRENEIGLKKDIFRLFDHKYSIYMLITIKPLWDET
jgi:hypothetical protein